MPAWFQEGHPLSLLLRNVSDMDFAAEDAAVVHVVNMEVEYDSSSAAAHTELTQQKAAVFGPGASVGAIDETLVNNIWEILSGADIDPGDVVTDEDSSPAVVMELGLMEMSDSKISG